MTDVARLLSDAKLLGPWFRGESWDAWRAIHKAAHALPLTDREREIFAEVAGGRAPPSRPVREMWWIKGRRSGGTLNAVSEAVYAAIQDYSGFLKPGERATVAYLACDRAQAKIAFDFSRAMFDTVPLLRAMVDRESTDEVALNNNVTLAIHTSSYRAVRGRAYCCVVMDETAYMRDETSATPDVELYRALVPGLATLPGSMLIGFSSPYRQRGLLYKKFRDHYGRDNNDVLVVKAATRQLNPTIPQRVVDDALADDPAGAASEWLAEFRSDLEDFVGRDVAERCVVPDRRELRRVPDVQYFAFVDPSGGSRDSMTLAVAHSEDGTVVIDAVRERRPPFDPDSVVREFAEVVRSYGQAHVVGDAYAGEWPRDRFRKRGIEYATAKKRKSDLYLSLLPLVNAGRIELPDHPRLITQLCSLERRTARGGKDTIDHPPGAHDDLVNSVAGAAWLAAQSATAAATVDVDEVLVAPSRIRNYLDTEPAEPVVSVFDIVDDPFYERFPSW